MGVHHLALKCRDGFFFKDGRGWSTSTMNRAGAFDWPYPPTLLGVVRGAVGRALERARGTSFTKRDWMEQTEGVSLGISMPLRRPIRQGWSASNRMWPVPTDALYVEDCAVVQRLEPTALKDGVRVLGRGDDKALETLAWPQVSSKAKPVSAPRWWSDALFMAWLRGDQVVWDPTHPKAGRPEQPRRTDVRLAVNPQTFTAAESMLFSIEVVEPWERDEIDGEHEWAIGVAVSLPDAVRVSLDEQIYVFGGNGRVGSGDALDASLFELTEAATEGTDRRLKVYAVTPASFAGGWLPDGLQSDGETYRGRLLGVDSEVVLRGAMVPRPVHWSGWNMEKGGPRQTKRLVPAGAVYVFEKASQEPFTAEERRSLWLASWGQDKEMGFGRVVAGVSRNRLGRNRQWRRGTTCCTRCRRCTPGRVRRQMSSISPSRG